MIYKSVFSWSKKKLYLFSNSYTDVKSPPFRQSQYLAKTYLLACSITRGWCVLVPHALCVMIVREPPFLPYNMDATSTIWYIHFGIPTCVACVVGPIEEIWKWKKWSTPLFNLSLESNFHPKKKIELCSFIQISMTKKLLKTQYLSHALLRFLLKI